MIGILSVEKSEKGLIAGDGSAGLDNGDSIEWRFILGLRGDCIREAANLGNAKSHGLVIDIQALDLKQSTKWYITMMSKIAWLSYLKSNRLANDSFSRYTVITTKNKSVNRTYSFVVHRHSWKRIFFAKLLQRAPVQFTFYL